MVLQLCIVMRVVARVVPPCNRALSARNLVPFSARGPVTSGALDPQKWG